MDQRPRTRTVTWQDPLPGASAARELGGLEYLLAMIDGRFPRPPISELLGFALVEAEPGRAVFAVTPGEHHYNPIGVVHGGLAATLLDSAMGCAVQSTLSRGTGYTTLEIKVNLVRAITMNTGPLRCAATVVHSGSRIATAEGRLVDAAGKLYAHGTTTCMLFKHEGEQRGAQRP